MLSLKVALRVPILLVGGSARRPGCYDGVAEMEILMAHVVKLTTEQIAERLRLLEETFQMSAQDFYDRYRAGDLGDAVEVIRWAGFCHMAERAGLLTPRPAHA